MADEIFTQEDGTGFMQEDGQTGFTEESGPIQIGQIKFDEEPDSCRSLAFTVL